MAASTKTLDDRGSMMPLIVPSSWIPRLNALARDRGVNRSALVRSAIESALLNGEQRGTHPAPIAAGKE